MHAEHPLFQNILLYSLHIKHWGMLVRKGLSLHLSVSPHAAAAQRQLLQTASKFKRSALTMHPQFALLLPPLFLDLLRGWLQPPMKSGFESRLVLLDASCNVQNVLCAAHYWLQGCSG
jgi:hypothetical protein